MSNSTLLTGMQLFQQIAAAYRAGTTDNLIDFTKPARVEPIVLIDSAVMLEEDLLTNIMQSCLSQFSGLYLAAASLMIDVNGVAVRSKLDRLNPNRDPMHAGLASGWLVSAEAYNDGLPDAKRYQVALENDLIPTAAKGQVTSLRDADNLSVGKMLEVNVGDAEKQYTALINVRLIPQVIASSTLAEQLGHNNEDRSFTALYHSWKMGEKELIADVVFCRDVLQAKRRALIKDSDGALTEIVRRRRNNGLSTILSGQISVATASNVAIMADTTVAMLEDKIGGRITDVKVRERIFDETSLLMMAIVDRSLNRVRFYHRSIPTPTDLNYRQLRGSNKDNGPNITDILQAYQLGKSPSLSI